MLKRGMKPKEWQKYNAPECVPHQEIIKERPTTKVKNAMYGWFDR